MVFAEKNKTFFHSFIKYLFVSITKKGKPFDFPSCTPSGARTLDPLIKSQLLYQLS